MPQSQSRTIAEEGGLNSVRWSGIRKRGEDGRLRLSARFDRLKYSIEIGFPGPLAAALAGEPMIKEERIEATQGKRTVLLMERKNSFVSVRSDSGAWSSRKDAVLPSEAALAGFFNGKECPEIDLIRSAMLGWRFYHDFRTDPASPVRKPCLAITTPSLGADGSDLAAAWRHSIPSGKTQRTCRMRSRMPSRALSSARGKETARVNSIFNSRICRVRLGRMNCPTAR